MTKKILDDDKDLEKIQRENNPYNMDNVLEIAHEGQAEEGKTITN